MSSHHTNRSSNSQASVGVSILFDMNSELILDPVDKMHNKLGKFIPSDLENSLDSNYNEYIILEGGFYTGFMKKNKPHGFGCLLLNTGQIYEGMFKRGKIRGLGRMIDLDGTAYEGYWKNNDIKEDGKIMWLDGKVYTGPIKKIKPHGHGVLVFEDNSKYQGSFRKGFMHGKGVKFWADGTIYAGQWKLSKMHGFGILLWTDKYYAGNLLNNEIVGIGRMEWQNGDVYVGQWLEGKRHGMGTLLNHPNKKGKWIEDRFKKGEVVSLQDFESQVLEKEIQDKIEKIIKSDEMLSEYADIRLFSVDLGLAHNSSEQRKNNKEAYHNFEENFNDKIKEKNERNNEEKNEAANEYYEVNPGSNHENEEFSDNDEGREFSVHDEFSENLDDSVQVPSIKVGQEPPEVDSPKDSKKSPEDSIVDNLSEDLNSSMSSMQMPLPKMKALEHEFDSESSIQALTDRVNSSMASIQIPLPRLEQVENEETSLETFTEKLNSSITSIQMPIPSLKVAGNDYLSSQVLSPRSNSENKDDGSSQHSFDAESLNKKLNLELCEPPPDASSDESDLSIHLPSISDPLARESNSSPNKSNNAEKDSHIFDLAVNLTDHFDSTPVKQTLSDKNFKTSSLDLQDLSNESEDEECEIFIPKLNAVLPKNLNESSNVSFADEHSIKGVNEPKEDSFDEQLPKRKVSEFPSIPSIVYQEKSIGPSDKTKSASVSVNFDRKYQMNVTVKEEISKSETFYDESFGKLEKKSLFVPPNVDLNELIKASEPKSNAKDTEIEGISRARLEKVLVSNHSHDNRVPLSTKIQKYSVSIEYSHLEAYEDRETIPDQYFKDLSQSEVLENLQFFVLPVSPSRYEALLETRELLEPFDYFDPDLIQKKVNLYFVPWVKCQDSYYTGQVDSLGNRHGIGIELLPHSLYEGYWKNNQRSGLGRVITTEGDNFEGYWTNDVKRGFGALWKTSGAGFVGEWECDVPEGKGIEVSPLEIYEGDFHLGMRHGKGVLTQTNLTFTGEFFQGMVNGYGVVKWPNKSAYAGIFINGESKGMKGTFMPGYSKITLTPLSPAKLKKIEKKKAQLKKIEEVVDNTKEEDSSEEELHTKNEIKSQEENIESVNVSFQVIHEDPQEAEESPRYTQENEANLAPPNEMNPINVLNDKKLAIIKPVLISPEKPKDDDQQSAGIGPNESFHIKKSILKPKDHVKSNKDISFEEGLKNLTDEQIQQKKAKFKSANKDKGAESVLKAVKKT